jgi:malate permease and related proteins
MIAELAAILLPVFCLAGAGFAWRMLGLPFERDFVTRLVMNLGAPCLIVDSLSRLALPIDAFLKMALGAFGLLAGCAAAGALLLRAARLPLRSYVPSLTFGNAGNIGLPLCLFAFGEEGLALAMAVYIAGSVTQFTLAPMLQSRAPALRTLIRTPVVYATVIGLALLASGTVLPQWLARSISLCGNIAIPLMLLALGNTLAGLGVGNARLATGLGIARIAIGFAVALGVSALFGLRGVARGVLVLQGGMPTAVVTYLLAARYQRNAEDIAGIVLASTLAAALLLPLLVACALWLGR